MILERMRKREREWREGGREGERERIDGESVRDRVEEGRERERKSGGIEPRRAGEEGKKSAVEKSIGLSDGCPRWGR